jgi:superfamily II DNA/RNA helicase
VLQRIERDAAAAGEQAAAPAAAPAKSAGSSRRRGRGGGNSGTQLPPAGGTPQALIVVPTRELAVQVCTDLAAAGSTEAVRVQALYGGRAYEPQVKALSEGIDIAVATPGRLLDLVNQGHLRLGLVRTLVLDEADEMLDLGFLPDVERIIKQLPAQRQTMLFSATMPGAVISLARQYMNRPTHIRAADPHDEGVSVANIKQFVYRAHDLDKIEMLARILQARGRGLTMVFARTKRAVARITEELQDRHFAVGAVHGDLAQGAREQALRAFRNGKVDVLVATDVAARGIDVEGVTHVVNYQCPEDEKVYTHRIGRTGRAGRTGTSVTLVDWEDMPRWGLINKALVLDHAEPVELYSTSPQLYADLDIPDGAKGALPKQDRVRAGLDAEEIEDLGETGRRGKGPKRAEPEPEPRRERTPRQRRRTRAGRGEAAAPSAEQAAALGAAPVTELFREPGAEQADGRADANGQSPETETAGTTRRRGAGEEPKTGDRRRTRTARAEAPAAGTEAAATAETPAQAGAAPVAEAAAETAERPKRTRTRKRAAAAPAEPEAVAETVAEAPTEAAAAVAAVAESVLGKPAEAETASASATEEAEKPAKKRTRKRATAPSTATQPEAAAVETVVTATVADGPEAAAADEAPAKPARKRATRKAASPKTTPAEQAAAEQAPAPEPASANVATAKAATAKAATAKAATAKAATAESGAEPAAAEPRRARPAKKAAARAKSPKGAKESAEGTRGNSIRLAPGSLADPGAPAPEPVRPAAVNEPVELSEPVFTQEPILPTSQRTPRTPRKRPAKRSVAAQGSPHSAVSASVPAASVPAEEPKPAKDTQAAKVAKDTQVEEDHTETAILDAVNVGPVANRRRVQI